MPKRSCMRWEKRDRLQDCLVLKLRLLSEKIMKALCCNASGGFLSNFANPSKIYKTIGLQCFTV